MNELPAEIKDFTHEQVLNLKEKVKQECILDDIVFKWAELYETKIKDKKYLDDLYQEDRERAIDNIYFRVEPYDPQSDFFILSHSKILTPALYKMVGIKFLEMDFRDMLEDIKSKFLVHLDLLRSGKDEVLSPEELKNYLFKKS